MERYKQNGSPARQTSLHAYIIRKQKPRNSAPPYPYSHLQRNSYRTRHLPALWREKKTYSAATANAARFISQPNALHRHTQRASSDREIFCSWEKDFLQLGKRFAAIGKEICCDWKWNAAKQVTNLTERDDEIG